MPQQPLSQAGASQPQAGAAISQPQVGSAISQPQAGSQASQPWCLANNRDNRPFLWPKQPLSQAGASQPQAGASQPQAGAAISQPQAGSTSQQASQLFLPKQLNRPAEAFAELIRAKAQASITGTNTRRIVVDSDRIGIQLTQTLTATFSRYRPTSVQGQRTGYGHQPLSGRRQRTDQRGVVPFGCLFGGGRSVWRLSHTFADTRGIDPVTIGLLETATKSRDQEILLSGSTGCSPGDG
jgi:hypothetical protein